MKNVLRFSVAVALVSLAAVSANAISAVPEIDPSMGAGALALIAGGMMVIRGRRRR